MTPQAKQHEAALAVAVHLHASNFLSLFKWGLFLVFQKRSATHFWSDCFMDSTNRWVIHFSTFWWSILTYNQSTSHLLCCNKLPAALTAVAIISFCSVSKCWRLSHASWREPPIWPGKMEFYNHLLTHVHRKFNILEQKSMSGTLLLLQTASVKAKLDSACFKMMQIERWIKTGEAKIDKENIDPHHQRQIILYLYVISDMYILFANIYIYKYYN